MTEWLCGAAWKLTPMGFTTAAVVAEQRGDIIQVTTGCKEFDNILEGIAQDVSSSVTQVARFIDVDRAMMLQVVSRPDPSRKSMVRTAHNICRHVVSLGGAG